MYLRLSIRKLKDIYILALGDLKIIGIKVKTNKTIKNEMYCLGSSLQKHTLTELLAGTA